MSKTRIAPTLRHAIPRPLSPREVMTGSRREPVRTYNGADAYRELRALLAVVRAVERVQWHGADIQGRDACIICNGAKADGHFPRCPIARLARVSERSGRGRAK